MKPFNPPPLSRDSPPAKPSVEVVSRLKRIESRMVQLMKHVGMTTDGRKALPPDAIPHSQGEPHGPETENR